ncbi:MAG: hypothetical protein K9H16_11710 [Bacteroidales bacterium]|nr:hypothetical protein [Bacteroidales bacterium]
MNKPALTHLTILLITMLVLTIAACNKSNDEKPQPATALLSLKFEHIVGDDPLMFNQMIYTNAFGNPYSVETLKYFISDIKLTSAQGSEYLIDAEHYVDGLDSSTSLFETGAAIPLGEYSSVSFIFGLNKEKNLPGLFPNAPESLMEWPPAMGTGYHYMKLEGKTDSSGVINNFQAHTGPTMNNQNFIELTVPNSSFMVSGNSTTITIKMDINKWWANPNILDLNTVSGIMGNQEMQLKLKANGEDVFSFGGV